MPRQSLVKQTESVEVRLANEAQRLRKEARGMPPGVARDAVIRRARQAETGSQMSESVRSPEIKSPT
jgi:hypothetical protein